MERYKVNRCKKRFFEKDIDIAETIIEAESEG
jgi:hypothetical protein